MSLEKASVFAGLWSFKFSVFYIAKQGGRIGDYVWFGFSGVRGQNLNLWCKWIPIQDGN